MELPRDQALRENAVYLFKNARGDLFRRLFSALESGKAADWRARPLARCSIPPTYRRDDRRPDFRIFGESHPFLDQHLGSFFDGVVVRGNRFIPSASVRGDERPPSIPSLGD